VGPVSSIFGAELPLGTVSFLGWRSLALEPVPVDEPEIEKMGARPACRSDRLRRIRLLRILRDPRRWMM